MQTTQSIQPRRNVRRFLKRHNHFLLPNPRFCRDPSPCFKHKLFPDVHVGVLSTPSGPTHAGQPLGLPTALPWAQPGLCSLHSIRSSNLPVPLGCRGLCGGPLLCQPCCHILLPVPALLAPESNEGILCIPPRTQRGATNLCQTCTLMFLMFLQCSRFEFIILERNARNESKLKLNTKIYQKIEYE